MTERYKVELTWADLVEFEVNKRFGGEATVASIVTLMVELGWRPPARVGFSNDERPDETTV